MSEAAVCEEKSAAVSESLSLDDEIAVLAAQLDAGTHRLLTCIRKFDASEDWLRQGAQSCAHWLAWRIGLDPATAREKVRVSRALGTLPAIDRALAEGRLSYAKVRALTRVATPDTDQRLVEIATATTGAQLERICRRFRRVRGDMVKEGLVAEELAGAGLRSVRVRGLDDGMVRVEITLHPDEADLVVHAIDRARDQLRARPPAGSPQSAVATQSASEAANGRTIPPPSPGWADGVVFMAELMLTAGDLAGETVAPVSVQPEPDLELELDPGPEAAAAPVATPVPLDTLAGTASRVVWGSDRYQVFIHLEQSPLDKDGVMGVFLDDGTRVSAETFRRLSCDGGLVAVRGDIVSPHGGKGPGQLGRRTRAISPTLRRALWLRDGGCRFPGCANQRFVHGHHIRHWADGGPTSKDNLVLLCSFHHRMLHEGGFIIAGSGDNDLQFLDRRKRVIGNVPGVVDLTSDEYRPTLLALENDLPRDAAVNACGWDGDPIDTDEILDTCCHSPRPRFSATRDYQLNGSFARSGRGPARWSAGRAKTARSSVIVARPRRGRKISDHMVAQENEAPDPVNLRRGQTMAAQRASRSWPRSPRKRLQAQTSTTSMRHFPRPRCGRFRSPGSDPFQPQ
ncbi:MAG: DUF222 domain-containing protein [Polyangia bacterium]